MVEIDYAARLANVSAAIDALVTGGVREYTIDGQRVTKLDLAELRAEEARLTRIVNRAGRTGGAFTQAVPR